MMGVDTVSAFRAHLGAFAPLAALLGVKIYPQQADPLALLPYAVFTVIFGTPENDLQGWSGTDRLRVQVSCFATKALAATAIADQVRQAMAQPNAAFSSVCISQFDGPMPHRGAVETEVSVHHAIVEFSLLNR